VLHPATINPGVFDGANGMAYCNSVAAVMRDFCHNCILASLADGNLQWELQETMRQELPEDCRVEIQTLFARLRDLNRILPYGLLGQFPTNNSEWLDEALRHNLFAVIARNADITAHPVAATQDHCVPVETASLNAHWNSRSQQQLIDRCSAQIQPLLEPVLQWSTRVRVIDYILGRDLWEGHQNAPPTGGRRWSGPVRYCLGQWAANGTERVEFIICTEWPRQHGSEQGLDWADATNLRAAAEDWIQRAGLAGLLPDDESKTALQFWKCTDRRFHRNRFLSTEVACVQVGKGFDYSMATADGQDSVLLLEEAGARSVENEFRLYEPAPLEIPITS